MTASITRKKVGKNYHYFKGDERITDQDKIERINKLAIPPAWKRVEIAVSKSAKVQAKGYDASGRLQSLYHSDFRLQQDKAKFERILKFAEKLPDLRRQIEKDIAQKDLNKNKVLACIVRLIDMAYFRVGNERYASEHQTYGVTTLRSKHTSVNGSTVVFDFVGKSGKKHHKVLKDKQIARIIKQLDELPGHEIFRYQDSDGTMRDLHASDVNLYVKEHMGDEFTAKDFRTWGGTLVAATAIIQDDLDKDVPQTARKKQVAKIVKQVAKKLGLTRETAGQVLKKLELKKLLAKSRNTYVLYVEQLKKYLDK